MVRIDQRSDGRVLVVDVIEYSLPALSVDATVHVWQKSSETLFFVQQICEPEEIPAQSGFYKIATLELEADPEVSASILKKQACDSIDLAADDARQRFVSPGSLIDQEYKEAYGQAKAWLDSGADQYTAPQSVINEAQVRRMSNIDAAQFVVRTGDNWAELLMQIRKVRNQAKAAINSAANDADFSSIAQNWIDNLAQIKPV